MTLLVIPYIEQWVGAGMAEMLKNKDWNKLTDPATYMISPYGDKWNDFRWNTMGMGTAAEKLGIPGPYITFPTDH